MFPLNFALVLLTSHLVFCTKISDKVKSFERNQEETAPVPMPKFSIKPKTEQVAPPSGGSSPSSSASTTTSSTKDSSSYSSSTSSSGPSSTLSSTTSLTLPSSAYTYPVREKLEHKEKEVASKKDDVHKDLVIDYTLALEEETDPKEQKRLIDKVLTGFLTLGKGLLIKDLDSHFSEHPIQFAAVLAMLGSNKVYEIAIQHYGKYLNEELQKLYKIAPITASKILIEKDGLMQGKLKTAITELLKDEAYKFSFIESCIRNYIQKFMGEKLSQEASKAYKEHFFTLLGTINNIKEIIEDDWKTFSRGKFVRLIRMTIFGQFMVDNYLSDFCVSLAKIFEDKTLDPKTNAEQFYLQFVSLNKHKMK